MKKIIEPKKPVEVDTETLPVVNDIDRLVSVGLDIMSEELHKYRSRSRNIAGNLDQKEARIVTGYCEALVKMSREVREQTKQLKLDGLSEEELEALVLELSKKNQ